MAKGGRGQRARKTKREAAGKTKERTRERGRAKELRKRDGERREGEWGEETGKRRKEVDAKGGKRKEMRSREDQRGAYGNVGGKESKTEKQLEKSKIGEKDEIRIGSKD